MQILSGGDGASSTAEGKQQTVPPSIPISELFSGGPYPVGEECEYPPDKDG